jgi:hypothetical protein
MSPVSFAIDLPPTSPEFLLFDIASELPEQNDSLSYQRLANLPKALSVHVDASCHCQQWRSQAPGNMGLDLGRGDKILCIL